MKKHLLLFFLLPVVFSCKQSSSPKETAQTFIKSFASSDMNTASALVTAESRPVMEKAKGETKSVQQPDESFQLNTLSETINGETAEVKNEILSLQMVKEEEGWKVVMDESLLNAIRHRDERLAAAKARWDDLHREYEARLALATTYIDFKKRDGALSPAVKALDDAIAGSPKETAWTKEKILAYAQKQQEVNKLLEAALEPSRSAGTDLSLNYILQISNAGDRIKAAEGAYQEAAQEAHSPVYVPLPAPTNR